MANTTISLDGISSPGAPETRALAHLGVTYNGNTYNWQIFIPQGEDLNQFLANSVSLIETQIDEKEAKWAALTPKTRTFTDMMGQPVVVDIQKDEIVRPDIPDYYARRRDSYPSLGEQLGALWKGPSHPDYIAMTNTILAVKDQYPKPNVA